MNQGANYLVAETEGKIVGFAAGNRTRDEDVKDKFDAEVYAIYVLREHQNHGAGRLLIKEIGKSFEGFGFKSMCVWVLRDSPSCGFYEKLGGKYVMEKPINFGGKTLQEVAYGWGSISSGCLNKA